MEMHRNSRCWCGSGKKYKQCHEKFDEKIREFARNGEIVPDRSLIKSTKDIFGIKKSAAINTGVLDHVAKHIHVGMSTGDIDRLVYDYTVSHGAIPAPLNYEGFPKSVCTSVNDEVCHGIPDDEIILQEGDIVNVDVSTIFHGYYSDASRMFMIGEVSEEAKRLVQVTKECLEIGVSVRCHLEDITRADIYGYVIPFCLELMKLRQQYGIPVKVRCCDTMGYGVNYPGAVIPRSVPGIIYGIMVHAGVPSELIEWHGHNDFYKAVSNSTTAWLYGACGVNTSLFGIGERTGNTPLEAMVFEYAQLRGNLGGMDTTVITELAEYYEKEIGYHIPERTPFVGKNFNVTRAGIHADGLLKNEEIYNVFDTEKFLNRPVEVAVSNTSGAAGIAHWIDSHYRLKGDQKVDKNSELVKMIKSWVDQQYEDGRVTVLCDAELEAIVAETCQRLGITLK